VSGKFTQEDLLRMIQIVSDTEFKIKKSPNPRVKLEMCILTLLKMNRSVTLTQVIEQLSGLKSDTVADLDNKPSVKQVSTQTSQPDSVAAKESERKVSVKGDQKKNRII
jgi:DNA polymerase III gamma/tau subunit